MTATPASAARIHKSKTVAVGVTRMTWSRVAPAEAARPAASRVERRCSSASCRRDLLPPAAL
eukprot:5276241-Prymnesium_polylepis.1